MDGCEISSVRRIKSVRLPSNLTGFDFQRSGLFILSYSALDIDHLPQASTSHWRFLQYTAAVIAIYSIP